MDYAQTLDYLLTKLPMYSRIGAAAYRADLNNTWQLTDFIAIPNANSAASHIAGTNGKGSTSHIAGGRVPGGRLQNRPVYLPSPQRLS